MTQCDAIILDSRKEGLFDAINPEALSAKGSLWNMDVSNFGPWHQEDQHCLIENFGGKIWKPNTGTGEQMVIICGKCTSSMDVAWYLIAENRLPEWDSILAVEQTTGRGQYQRKWISPPGNIHAAWRWPYLGDKYTIESQWFGFFSLIAGYLIARIINEEFKLDVQIKWPNDLLIYGKKIGGILTEVRSGQLVVGIGLNILYSPDDKLLRNDFSVSATNLRDEGANVTPLCLWKKIAEKGRLYFNQIISLPAPDEFIKLLRPQIIWMGQLVLVKIGQETPFKAVISGISDRGGLILRSDGKNKIIYSGSILPAESAFS